MAKNNRGNRGGRNNNPEGHNQYNSGWMDTAKDRPMATAAAAAAAVGAGVFLWSRRNQISDQISSLSNQISDWSHAMGSGSDGEMAMAGTDSAYEDTSSTGSTTGRRGGRKSQSDLSAEALTLKQTGATSNRPKGGAIG